MSYLAYELLPYCHAMQSEGSYGSATVLVRQQRVTLPTIRQLGMGPRYVISVTKNEARNEAGCYQNRIASHFNLAAGLCRAAISPF